MDTLLLEEMTWPMVEKAVKEGWDTVIVAVGSMEQHGHHLPLGTDTFLGDLLAVRLAERLGKAVVAPTIRPGCSSHHMAFPGTLDLSPDTLMRVVREVCLSLDHHGFRRIILMPTHGGNFAAVQTAAREIGPKLKAKLVALADLSGLTSAMQAGAVEAGIPREAVGCHACAGETSLMLGYRPELVRMDSAAPGYIGPFRNELFSQGFHTVSATGVLGDPRPATREAGQRIIEKILDMYLAVIESR